MVKMMAVTMAFDNDDKDGPGYDWYMMEHDNNIFAEGTHAACL